MGFDVSFVFEVCEVVPLNLFIEDSERSVEVLLCEFVGVFDGISSFFGPSDESVPQDTQNRVVTFVPHLIQHFSVVPVEILLFTLFLCDFGCSPMEGVVDVTKLSDFGFPQEEQNFEITFAPHPEQTVCVDVGAFVLVAEIF